MEKDKNFIKVFFKDFNASEYEECEVSREDHHRDIIIWLKKADEKKRSSYLVIENKIKSLQRRDQLEEYTTDIDKCALLQGTYTGIKNALDEDTIEIKGVKWSFVDYRSISQGIREIAHESADHAIQDHILQIEEYCDVVDRINDLMEMSLKKSSDKVDYLYEGDEGQCLKELRIHDVYIKLKGAQILKNIEEKLQGIDKPGDDRFRLELNQGFYNGKATINIRYTSKKDTLAKNDDYLTIGIELEGYQYRLLAERNASLPQHDSETVFETFKKIGWFESFDPNQKERKLFGRDTSMKRAYNKYSGRNDDKYIMVYQHYDIEGWKLEQVIENIKNDLRKACAIINDHKYED